MPPRGLPPLVPGSRGEAWLEVDRYVQGKAVWAAEAWPQALLPLGREELW